MPTDLALGCLLRSVSDCNTTTTTKHRPFLINHSTINILNPDVHSLVTAILLLPAEDSGHDRCILLD